MIIVGTDIETTGLKQEAGHRITEIAMDIYHFDGKKPVAKGIFHTLVNPERTIPDNIQNLTGITPSMVAKAPTWAEVAPKVSKILNATDVLVAHNIDFDAPFLVAELLRVGQSVNDNIEAFCTMENGRFATPLGKCPKLTELCWALEVDFADDAAHRADYDTMKMMEALWAGVELGEFVLPEKKSVTEVKAA